MFLVYSGGSFYGFSYIGVLQVLEDAWGGADALHGALRGAAGTSMGSVFALCSVLGLSSDDILRRVAVPLLASGLVPKWHAGAAVVGGRPVGWKDFWAALCEPAAGLVRLDSITDFLDRALELPPGLTFAELHGGGGVLRDLELVVVVARVGARGDDTHAEYRSWRTTPHESVTRSVALSCSLPFLIESGVETVPVVDRWGRLAMSRQLLVDGGVVDNFPRSVFPESETLAVRVCNPSLGVAARRRDAAHRGQHRLASWFRRTYRQVVAWRLGISSAVNRDWDRVLEGGACPGDCDREGPDSQIIDVRFRDDPVAAHGGFTLSALSQVVTDGHNAALCYLDEVNSGTGVFEPATAE